jgi:hypothetical protein
MFFFKGSKVEKRPNTLGSNTPVAAAAAATKTL